MSVRDGAVTFTGPRSAPLTLPLTALTKVIVVERINLGRGARTVVIFCGPDGRQVWSLQSGRWGVADLLALARATSTEPMFYPGRTTPRRLEAEQPGALTFWGRNAVRITAGVVTAVALVPVVTIAFVVWAVVLVF